MPTTENATQSSKFSGDMVLHMPQKDKEDINNDFANGNWEVSSTRSLIDFRPVRNCGLPIVYCLNSTSDCILIDMFSQETSITNISDFRSRICQEMNIIDVSLLFRLDLLYSKEGWMLFRGPSDQQYLLLNIVSGERLHLPDNTRFKPGRHCNYAFSTSSSVDYVVYVVRENRTGWTTICIARPGDEVWKVCTSTTQFRPGLLCLDYIAVVIAQKRVYCFDGCGMIDLFDIPESIWVSLTLVQSIGKSGTRLEVPVEKYMFHVLEVDDIGIVKVYPPSDDFNLYRFFRLEVDEHELLAAWVELTEQQVEGRSWFVGWRHSFCVKSQEKEAAVYEMTVEDMRADHGKDTVINVHVRGLKAGTSHIVFPAPMYPVRQLGWINLA